MKKPHDYECEAFWYAALCEIAKKHDNLHGVRDFVGWTHRWEFETPEESYYAEFPEHRKG